MARNTGDFIKDVRYEKFYVINYQYRGEYYILCNVVVDGLDYNIFRPIPIKVIDREKLDVIKFETEEKAKKELTNLPDVVINGYEMELEVNYNAYNEFLIGV